MFQNGKIDFISLANNDWLVMDSWSADLIRSLRLDMAGKHAVID